MKPNSFHTVFDIILNNLNSHIPASMKLLERIMTLVLFFRRGRPATCCCCGCLWSAWYRLTCIVWTATCSRMASSRSPLWIASSPSLRQICDSVYVLIYSSVSKDFPKQHLNSVNQIRFPPFFKTLLWIIESFIKCLHILNVLLVTTFFFFPLSSLSCLLVMPLGMLHFYWYRSKCINTNDKHIILQRSHI